MSWLTEIAGKAENFLNAVDKGAANALTNVQKTTNNRKQSLRSDQHNNDQQHLLDAEFIDTPEIMSLKTSPSTNSLISENGNNQKMNNKGHNRSSSYDSNGSHSSNSKSNNEDDRLMEYLNNKDNDIPEEEWQTLNNSSNNNSNSNNNKSQIKELDSLNKRILELNTEFKKQKLKAQNYHNQLVTNEKLIKELKSKESDMIASISVKDSQIAALKVQNEQMLIEIQEKEDKFKEIELLNQQLNQTIQNKQNDTVLNLDKEIESLKQQLKFEKEESKRIQENNNQQIIRLEDNQRSLLEELENYRRLLNESKNDRSEMELNFNLLQKKLETIQEEYEQFKLKANKTLKDKDELIQRLNQTKVDDHLVGSNENNNSNYIEVLQEQCNTLVNELTDLRSKYDQMKQDLELAQNEQIPKQQYELNSLNEQLQQEKSLNKNLKNEIIQLTKDCKLYQDDLNQIKLNLSARITERDEEIDKLRKQLMLKQQQQYQLNSNSQMDASPEEWKQRLKSLTENLLTKQSLIEQLQSANHSLKLQLERSENKLREFISSSDNLNNDVAIGIYHSPSFTSLIKHRMNNSGSGSTGDSIPLIQDDPNDGQVTRKVKRAYSAIDAFSIRLGNFLRLYPSARAMFLIYILILHIWVAFVLLYYEPEVHGRDFYTK